MLHLLNSTDSVDSERRLLQRIIDGDQLAKRELYDRYSAKAMAVCMRYVADDEVARDVLQESFVKVFTSIESVQFHGEGTLKAWVLRIVVNEAVNCLRNQTSHEEMITDRVPDVPEDQPPEEEPDVSGLPPGVLMELVEKLPAGYRTVLNLFVIEQRSHKEIAQLLGIKESTSASQFYHAKQMLIKMIEEYKNKQ